MWNSLYGTGAQKLQGLARASVRGLGETTYFDDGSTFTTDAGGSVIEATGAYPLTSYSPMNSGTGGNVQASSSFWGDVSGADVGKVLQAIIAAKQTYDVNELNMELIKQGRPPLSASQMQSIVPQVRVGIASDTQNMLVYGGLALAAVLLLPKLLK